MTTNTVREVASDDALLRYNRQIFLSDIDLEGQNKLLGSRVIIFGMGGLGSPISIYLAASGIGELVVVDPDTVDLTNLQRQVVHATDDLGRLKVVSAKETLEALNPDCKVIIRDRKLEGADLETEIELADVVVDGTDNFAARFAINRACVATKTPLVSGAVVRFEGQISTFRPDHPGSPCYECLYSNVDEPPGNCSENGVLGPVAGLIGCIQAIEVIKVLLDFGDTLEGRLMLVDARGMTIQTIKLNKDPGCKVCGD